MSKIKIVFYLALAFIFYKGFVAFQNFEIGVDDRIADIEEKADFEKEGEVIGLMMYMGRPLKLTEHLLTKNKSRCLEMKQTAEESSSAYYECARVNAVLKGRKIVSIINEIEVIE
ncbi:hypothetical protein N9C36_01250 [Candidatus Pelagibacter sp.]|jgi:hypothetical protein|nr:hypothetical protein [Candidatus Pelagibacter sp.]